VKKSLRTWARFVTGWATCYRIRLRFSTATGVYESGGRVFRDCGAFTAAALN
jgi:hypothetical protein